MFCSRTSISANISGLSETTAVPALFAGGCGHQRFLRHQNVYWRIKHPRYALAGGGRPRYANGVALCRMAVLPLFLLNGVVCVLLLPLVRRGGGRWPP